MSKREKIDQDGLDHSEDELLLSELMKKSCEGDSESYLLLLQKVTKLMTPFIANSLSKFGLASAGGQEDVLQDILLGIHLKRATFDSEQYFLPWMYAIARYKTIDYLRRNKATFNTVSIEESLEDVEFGQLPELNIGVDLVSLCESLSTKQRDLLMLVKVEGLTISEAADKTGYSVSDIKVTIHRAIKELKKHVKENGHEN